MPEFFSLFAHSSTYISLISLTAMEVVLGIDNVVFIAIVAGKLPAEQQKRARTMGLLMAFVFRVALLMAITWIAGLVHPLVTIGEFGLSGRDIIMLAGGFFLLYKSTAEIHEKVENSGNDNIPAGPAKFFPVVGQIIMLDIIFSFDSVVTAVGMVDEVAIMIMAVLLSLGVMLVFAGSISAFISKHPAVKMLALSFLLMIGTMLIAEGLHFHIPRGYVYFSMAFSLFVEVLNIKAKTRAHGLPDSLS